MMQPAAATHVRGLHHAIVQYGAAVTQAQPAVAALFERPRAGWIRRGPSAFEAIVSGNLSTAPAAEAERAVALLADASGRLTLLEEAAQTVADALRRATPESDKQPLRSAIGHATDEIDRLVGREMVPVGRIPFWPPGETIKLSLGRGEILPFRLPPTKQIAWLNAAARHQLDGGIGEPPSRVWTRIGRSRKWRVLTAQESRVVQRSLARSSQERLSRAAAAADAAQAALTTGASEVVTGQRLLAALDGGTAAVVNDGHAYREALAQALADVDRAFAPAQPQQQTVSRTAATATTTA